MPPFKSKVYTNLCLTCSVISTKYSSKPNNKLPCRRGSEVIFGASQPAAQDHLTCWEGTGDHCLTDYPKGAIPPHHHHCHLFQSVREKQISHNSETVMQASISLGWTELLCLKEYFTKKCSMVSYFYKDNNNI